MPKSHTKGSLQRCTTSPRHIIHPKVYTTPCAQPPNPSCPPLLPHHTSHVRRRCDQKAKDNQEPSCGFRLMWGRAIAERDGL